MAALAIAGAIAASVANDSAKGDGTTVPAKFRQGRAILSARVNGSEPMTFMLDSGCTIPTLHPGVVDQLELRPSGTVRINGIAGEERAPTYRGVVFDFGGVTYSPRRVASVPSERDHRRRTDGVLGSGLFDNFVVQMDHAEQVVRLFAPTDFQPAPAGEIIPFRFHKEIPVVRANIVLADKREIEAEFEIDTGCDSGVCLGDHFVKQHKLLEGGDNTPSEKFGIGGSVGTRNGSLPILRLGALDIKDAQTDFFLDASPVDEPLAGHIGMGVFRHYKLTLDYPGKRLVLHAPAKN